jgi:acyl-coenzyme A synthetase/AMP-(fatty) acid ligase
MTQRLKSIGLTIGDRVIIYMPSIVEAAETVLSCMALGLPFEFIPYRLGVSVLESSLRNLNPKVIVTV